MSTPIPDDVSIFIQNLLKSMSSVLQNSNGTYTSEEVISLLEKFSQIVYSYIQNNGQYKIVLQDIDAKTEVFDNQVFNFVELDDTIILQYFSDGFTFDDLADLQSAAETLQLSEKKTVLIMPHNMVLAKGKLSLENPSG